ncbi:hypothetical protein SLE2022_168090 [Rubroshorea leprosula]
MSTKTFLLALLLLGVVIFTTPSFAKPPNHKTPSTDEESTLYHRPRRYKRPPNYKPLFADQEYAKPPPFPPPHNLPSVEDKVTFHGKPPKYEQPPNYKPLFVKEDSVTLDDQKPTCHPPPLTHKPLSTEEDATVPKHKLLPKRGHMPFTRY